MTRSSFAMLALVAAGAPILSTAGDLSPRISRMQSRLPRPLRRRPTESRFRWISTGALPMKICEIYESSTRVVRRCHTSCEMRPSSL